MMQPRFRAGGIRAAPSSNQEKLFDAKKDKAGRASGVRDAGSDVLRQSADDGVAERLDSIATFVNAGRLDAQGGCAARPRPERRRPGRNPAPDPHVQQRGRALRAGREPRPRDRDPGRRRAPSSTSRTLGETQSGGQPRGGNRPAVFRRPSGGALARGWPTRSARGRRSRPSARPIRRRRRRTPTGGSLPFPVPAECGPFGPDNRFACAAAVAAQFRRNGGSAPAARGVNCHRFVRQVVYALSRTDANWRMIVAAPGGHACNCSGCGGSDGTMFREDTTAYGGNRVFDLVVGAGGPSPSLSWSPVPGPRAGDSPSDAPLCAP